MPRVGRFASGTSRGFALLVGATVALVAARLLPRTFLDGRPSLCLIRRATGRPCSGCGMTRALWLLVHGEVGPAMRLNWRVAVVAPILLVLYMRLAFRVVAGTNPGAGKIP